MSPSTAALSRSKRGKIQTKKREHLWSIVLAGGEGRRIRPVVERWLGEPRPKQFCAFVGTRSMLQHTLDRAGELAPPSQQIAVVLRQHQTLAASDLKDREVTILAQPFDRGTAAAIFLALAHVRAKDSQAILVIYPSDHFVYPEDQFVAEVLSAILAAEQMGDKLILLGASPDCSDGEYGHVWPGHALGVSAGHRVWSAQAFMEKPNATQATTAFASGALWSTMVLAGRADTFWGLGRQYLPEVMSLFEMLTDMIGTIHESEATTALYQTIPSLNFSADFLVRAKDHLGVMELNQVIWSDWGRAERIVESLNRIGREPAFLEAYTAMNSTKAAAMNSTKAAAMNSTKAAAAGA